MARKKITVTGAIAMPGITAHGSGRVVRPEQDKAPARKPKTKHKPHIAKGHWVQK